MIDDEKIIEMFFGRSEQGIRELDIKYGKVCHNLSYHIVGSRQDAEECVNDAYLGAWNAIPPARPNPLLSYLVKIVRNISLKIYWRKEAAKRSSHYTIALEEIEACIAAPNTVEAEIEAKELARIIEAFLDTLTTENRIIFMRRYWFSDSYKDIAEFMGLSEKNISVRLTRIREKMKQYLIEREVWKGTLTEDELGKVIEQNKNAMTQSSEENAIYGTTLQSIDDIRGFIISVLTPDAEYDESVLNQITEENVQEFYDTYHKNMEKMAEEYGKTSVQKKYLEKKYNEIKLPVEYESYSSWDTMIMYVETYSIILAIIVGFICAGIFADDFQTKADAVFFSTKYGRTKAVKTKILAGVVTTVMIYCMGIILLSVICFGIMGTSGMNTPYQMYQAYSIYIMSYGQYYLLTVVCGFIASMLAASVSMLVAAKMHTISVAVCIPFFLYCLLPFIGRALSGYTTLFNLIPTILTNVQASVKVPLIYQIGNCVFRQIPLVMVLYTVMAIALLPFIYKSFRRYGKK